ncbi:hypothetical protein NZK33_20820 [Cyanobium sp. FGCU-6]|nr:hypothetical protein [Cyanobium sp. FGCU6]
MPLCLLCCFLSTGHPCGCPLEIAHHEWFKKTIKLLPPRRSKKLLEVLGSKLKNLLIHRLVHIHAPSETFRHPGAIATLDPASMRCFLSRLTYAVVKVLAEHRTAAFATAPESSIFPSLAAMTKSLPQLLTKGKGWNPCARSGSDLYKLSFEASVDASFSAVHLMPNCP